MKKKYVIFLVIILSLCMVFTGCEGKPYTFKQSVDEIETIEIVDIIDYLEFTVMKTLSETEKHEFVKQFQTIEFNTVYLGGPPPNIRGDAIKITYSNGYYEIICDKWSYYVKNGKVGSIPTNCEKEDFDKLINEFLDNNLS